MHQKPTVKINVVDDRAILPDYGTPLSAGFDLAIIEDVSLGPLESGLFSTGLVIQAPQDHMLMIVPRSSTWRKWGITLGNTIGIVDEDFCGPEDVMHLYLHNPNPNKQLWRTIPAGTRLAQGIFVPITRANFEIVDGPIAQTRGGWGSTGD